MDQFGTARLLAKRLAREDLPDLTQLHLDEDVSRFLGGTRTAAVTANYLETNLRHWQDHGFGLWTLRTSDEGFVGRAGLRYVEVEGVLDLEIAYTLVRTAWGRGYATEIGRALVDIWKMRRLQPSLAGFVVKGNRASEHVLSKLGFSYERDAAFHDEICGVFRRRP